MLDKLAARLRDSDTDYRLLAPLLLSTLLVQAVTSLTRVTISYRAVELHLSIVWLGLIAATFAIFPGPITGLSRTILRHDSADASNKFCSAPRVTPSVVTTSSRIASKGGLVT